MAGRLHWLCLQAKELASRGAFACTLLDDMNKMSSGQLIFTVFSSYTPPWPCLKIEHNL